MENMGAEQRATLQANAPNQQAYFKQIVQSMTAVSKGGKELAGAFKGSGEIAKGMNQSFQGMQAKAGVIQKIVGMAFDAMAIGSSKVQKQLVGAFQKAFQEGDVIGMISGIVDAQSQFFDFSALWKPVEMIMKPFSIMMQMIGGQAAGIVATSDAFQQMIADIIANPQAITDFATKLADLILKLFDMDWTHIVNIISSMLDKIAWFVELIENMRAAPANMGAGLNAMGQGWTGFWNEATHFLPIGSTDPNKGLESGGGTNIKVEVGGMVSDSQLRRVLGELRTHASIWSA